tara:strand:- start:219 stop:740 length:522 start_codon:yes stop_codon:yes gene_type:complete
MKINFLRIFFVSIVFFIIVVFFFSLTQSSKYDTSKMVGKKISNFEIEEFYNNKLISEMELKKSNYNLINFWSSWCGPCRDEHEVLLKLKETNRLKIIGVNFKDKKPNAINFLEELGNPYNLILVDANGKKSIDFGIYGVPESILIDKNLTIVKKFVGPLKPRNYVEILEILNK